MFVDGHSTDAPQREGRREAPHAVHDRSAGHDERDDAEDQRDGRPEEGAEQTVPGRPPSRRTALSRAGGWRPPLRGGSPGHRGPARHGAGSSGGGGSRATAARALPLSVARSRPGAVALGRRPLAAGALALLTCVGTGIRPVTAAATATATAAAAAAAASTRAPVAAPSRASGCGWRCGSCCGSRCGCDCRTRGRHLRSRHHHRRRHWACRSRSAMSAPGYHAWTGSSSVDGDRRDGGARSRRRSGPTPRPSRP